jgi:hypothetical protein
MRVECHTTWHRSCTAQVFFYTILHKKLADQKRRGDAPNCSLSSDTGGNGPSFLAISGPLLYQMLHLHVLWLVRAETTLPSTIVSNPLN